MVASPTKAAAKLFGLTEEMREVWSWNFEEEVQRFLSLAECAGPNAVIALDTEFPGVLCQDTRSSDQDGQYKVLQESVGLLPPIQIGFAVSGADGSLRGAWTFNLLFNLELDLHMEASVKFLEDAGVNFQRHAIEGVSSQMLGQRLAKSPLICSNHEAPLWVVFSGNYDFGYFLSILSGRPLPKALASYDEVLTDFCPKRFDLRCRAPSCSLESLLLMHSIERHGSAHTAGSDALATLSLYFRVVRATDLSAREVPVISRINQEATDTGKLTVAIEEMKHSSPPAAPSASWGTSARWAMLESLTPWKRSHASLQAAILYRECHGRWSTRPAYAVKGGGR